jgi:hypothetical protein
VQLGLLVLTEPQDEIDSDRGKKGGNSALPGWRVHAFMDRIWLGKSYWKIHRKMDEPVVFLGKKHRVLFHDFPSACMIAEDCYPGDPDAVASALIHISTDEQCSADPEYRKFLENMERLSKERPRKRKTKKPRRTPKKDDPLERAIAVMEKIEEAERLTRALLSL